MVFFLKCWSSVGTVQKYVEVSGEFTELWVERGESGAMWARFVVLVTTTNHLRAKEIPTQHIIRGITAT